MNEKDDAISPEPANEEDNSEEEDGEEDDEDSNSDGEDSYSDLASSNDEEEEQEDVETKSVEGKVDVQNNKKKAGEIPFVFKGNPFLHYVVIIEFMSAVNLTRCLFCCFVFISVPEEYEEFHQLLQSYSDADQRTVLDRMIKSNHPALTGTNKAKMEKVFAFLMQYIHDIASGDTLKLLNNIVPVVFDLTQLVPSSNIASTLLDVLQEKREELSSVGKKRPVSIATVWFKIRTN